MPDLVSFHLPPPLHPYGDLRSLAASTSFAAAISGLVISFLPSVCGSEDSSELPNGFFTASLSLSVVVLWSELSLSSVDVEVDVDVSGAIGSVGTC